MSVFCAPKAGMAKVDTARVNSVVYHMSKDSLHFRHQQHLADNTTRRIQQLQRRIHTLHNEPPSYLTHLNQRASDLLLSLEGQRDLSHVWLHIDLDSFYASVELRDRPHLRDKPVAVGSMSMICTSNYHARQYGVRSAMPGFIAVKLCPQLHFIPTDFPKYKAVAAVFRAIFALYDQHFESASLDEAYLDITTHLAAKQARQPVDQPWDRDVEAAAVATEIRQRVFEATQLTVRLSSLKPSHHSTHQVHFVSTLILCFVICYCVVQCSAGIACNRMLAKIATDVNKPNGQHLVPFNLPAILSFISPLPVRQVPGIGKVLERTLNAIGVQTVGQMRDDEYRALLVDCFSELTYGWLFRISLGLGRVEHEDDDARRRKSVSTEQTFRDISSYAELTSKVDDIARSLYGDIERLGVKGRTLTLKLKSAAFAVKQHSVSVDRGLWIHKLEDVRRLALQLLKDELNRLLAGKKVKRAAEEKVEKAAAGAAAVVKALFSGANGASKVPVGSPFDGLMRIRLMGLRLSALYVDETGEADEEPVGDGGEQSAGGGSVKKRGRMSILKFAKPLVDSEQDAIVDDERAEQQSSKRQKAEADNTDISKYFDVASPDKSHTQPSSSIETEAARRRSIRGSRWNIESYFSQSMVADGAAKCGDEVDDVLEDDGETDEWMELLQDAAEASSIDQVKAGPSSHPLVAAAAVSAATSDKQQLPAHQQSVPSAVSSSSAPSPSTPASPAPTTTTTTSPPPASTSGPPPSAAPSVSLSCPVCGRELGGSDSRPVSNLALNSHIDACLRNTDPADSNKQQISRTQSSGRSAPHKAVASRGRGRGRQGRKAEEGQPATGASLVDMWKRKT